jgi:dTDP-4-dehydrorhamnose 3,5-epimerase
MRFTETPLAGAYVIGLERREDERGFFARSFCQEEFQRHGLDPRVAQCNISYNKKKGTLRGMHFQAAPHEEAKLVRCTAGSAYDVIVDLRSASRTFLQWHGIELSAHNRLMLFIPAGFAHGFLTLKDEVEIFYQMSVPHEPGSAGGFRWNDPAFRIQWPFAPSSVSKRDSGFPDFAK